MDETLKHLEKQKIPDEQWRSARKGYKENSEKVSKKPSNKNSRPSLVQDILFLFIKIAVISLVFLLIFTFVFGVCQNTDGDMKPSVKDGDLVVFYRLDKNYVAQDTLVLNIGGKMQVRRVIAVSGDVVDVNDNGLVINGAPQQETEIYESTQRYETGIEFPITVQEGQVFLLGDSRIDATDSRVYGAVNIDDTMGKVMTIVRRRNI